MNIPLHVSSIVWVCARRWKARIRGNTARNGDHRPTVWYPNPSLRSGFFPAKLSFPGEFPNAR